MWEKEKLLVTSNFSFSHNVFKRLVLQTRKNQGLFGKGLIMIGNFMRSEEKVCGICSSKQTCAIKSFPNKPWLLRVCSTSLLKTLWEKEKLLIMSNFSFFHSVFYQFGELSAIFITFEVVVCKVFQFGRV